MCWINSIFTQGLPRSTQFRSLTDIVPIALRQAALAEQHCIQVLSVHGRLLINPVCFRPFCTFFFRICHMYAERSPWQSSLVVLYVYTYTGCHRTNGPNFGRVFLMLKYTDITQNTYIQSWTVTKIMAREVWNFDKHVPRTGEGTNTAYLMHICPS